MGFRTIDLDTKEGMEKYKKLKETKSVKETFGDEGIEKFAPRPEAKEPEPTPVTDIPVVKQGVVPYNPNSPTMSTSLVI